MAKPGLCSILAAAAAAALAAGVALAVRSWRELPDARARLARDAEKVAALRELVEERRGYEALIAAYEALPQKTPPPMDALVARFLPNADPRIQPVDRVTLAHGWQMERTAVTLDRAALPDVWAWLQAAETARPPWRLAACTIEADAGTAGIARVSAQFEAIEKPAAPAGR